MREHLGDCPDCRTYYDRHLLLAQIDRGGMGPEERIAVGLGLAGKAPASSHAPLFGGVAVAAALVLLALGRPSVWSSHLNATRSDGVPHASHASSAAGSGEEGFTSRGGTVEMAGADLVAYRIASGGTPTRVESARIARTDELAFGYTNKKGWAYLLVFGVDEHAHVYWYHPVWEKAEDTPSAVSIQPGAAMHELPEAVSHPLDGTRLHLHGIFTNSPLSTRDVEQRLKAVDFARLERAFPDSFIWELDLRVEP